MTLSNLGLPGVSASQELLQNGEGGATKDGHPRAVAFEAMIFIMAAIEHYRKLVCSTQSRRNIQHAGMQYLLGRRGRKGDEEPHRTAPYTAELSLQQTCGEKNLLL